MAFCAEIADYHKKYDGRLRLYFASQRAHVDLIDDLTQDTWLMVVRHYATWRKECAFSTWLYVIARNVWYTYIRRSQYRAQHEDSSVPEWELDAVEGVELPADVAVVAGEAFARSERKHLIILRCVEGLQYDQMAERMGTNTSTVKTQFFREMSRLKNYVSNGHYRI